MHMTRGGFTTSAVAIALAFLGTGRAAHAQGYPGSRGEPLVERVLEHLNRSRSYEWARGRERRHFEKAQSNLWKFQERLRSGRWDNDRLDDGIDGINHLVSSDQLDPRDRRMLTDDLYALREFRATRGRYAGERRDPYYRR